MFTPIRNLIISIIDSFGFCSILYAPLMEILETTKPFSRQPFIIVEYIGKYPLSVTDQYKNVG